MRLLDLSVRPSSSQLSCKVSPPAHHPTLHWGFIRIKDLRHARIGRLIRHLCRVEPDPVESQLHCKRRYFFSGAAALEQKLRVDQASTQT